MLASHQVEELICTLACWDRPTLTTHFLNFHGGFPVDVTREFLDGLSVERLRHLLFALCVQNQRLPEEELIAV